MNALEPLYTLKVATQLIPMSSVPVLQEWLRRHAPEWPRRYVWRGRVKRRMRMLSQSELLIIRDHVVKTFLPEAVYPNRTPHPQVRRPPKRR